MTKNLSKQIEFYEGVRLTPYIDSQGVWTIAIGRNLRDTGISPTEILDLLVSGGLHLSINGARYLLENDLNRAIHDANSFSWFKGLDDVRQDVIIMMIFQLGLSKFKGFSKTISAIERRNFYAASEEMLDSEWAKQTPARAQDLARIMSSGSYLNLVQQI